MEKRAIITVVGKDTVGIIASVVFEIGRASCRERV